MLAAAPTTIAGVPMYEFECAACARRFEALADAGTESIECRHCGSSDTRRLLSTPAARMNLVKSPGATRKQERANAQLRARTKADFKAKRKRARERGSGGGG
jgi:putative FmdB family regulatory protein